MVGKKKKGKKMKDELDDNKREQVEPRPEPPAEKQDEQWAFPDWDKRPWVSTAAHRQNGE
jgi:hypothetical protein